MSEVLSFEQVAEKVQEGGNGHVLLGNGFSIAFDREIFAYSKLFEAAGIAQDERLSTVFAKLDTSDFELVMRTLRRSAEISEIYGANAPAMRSDADNLRQKLIHVISELHPYDRDSVSDHQAQACADFLSRSRTGSGCLFTLNYDLLLYWVGQRCLREQRRWDDSFRRPEGKLTWGEPKTQDIFYLHGALHLIDNGQQLVKLNWTDEDARLTAQITDKIAQNQFPLCVSEGKSAEKQRKIRSNPYLRHALEKFYEEMRDDSATLVIFGHSLDENDQHVLDAIREGGIKRVFVSVFRDKQNEESRKLRGKVAELASARHDLTVEMFVAESANVWGQKALTDSWLTSAKAVA